MSAEVLQLDPKRILLVKPSALGDVVHALPVANLLKRKWPGSSLAWLVSRPFAPLLELHPAVDEVIPFDRHRGASVYAHAGSARELTATLRERAFDLVVDLQGLFRSGWIAWQTRAPVRIGFSYAREGAAWFYSHRIPAKPGLRHAIERYLDVSERLGCGRGPVEFDLATTPDDETIVQDLLAPLSGQPFVVLLPGTNWQTKRWPAQHFASLARRLDRELHLRVVTAGAGDANEADQLIRTQSGIDCLSLVDQTTVRQLIALLRRASLVVCNDSGPMHLAAALGRPLVAPFGPTDPHRTGPYGSMSSVLRLDLPCAPCLSRSCIHQSCLQQLPVDTVFTRCLEQLESIDSTNE